MAGEAPTVQVVGAEHFQDTMKTAANELADLKAPSQAAGAMVLSAARARAPKVSGTLAGSLFVETIDSGVAVQASAIYAGPIHWGWPARNIQAQPFLTEAGAATEPAWVQGYTTEVEAIIGRVEGDK